MPDNSYPGHLVPQANYLALDCAPFEPEGYVLRWLDKPAEVDSKGMVSEKSFKFPQGDHLVRNFSVNLLGIYKLDDSAWQFAMHKDGPRYEDLVHLWKPGQQGLHPTPSEATHPGDGNWGFFWLPLNRIHGKTFSVGNDRYTCYVVHKPLNSNYWHFEFHFKNSAGENINDLYEKDLLKSSKLRGIATGVRAKLLTEAKVEDIGFQEWPEAMYCKEHWLKRAWNYNYRWISSLFKKRK